jgi:hypothetical protein
MNLRKKIFYGLSVLLFLAATSGPAQTQRPSEYQLKAAFLYNFAKFIDWPPAALADDRSPFIIGVLGDNPFGNNLDQIVAGKTINGHSISVQFFNSAAEAARCQILFISNSEKKHFPDIIKSLNGSAVLTVSETERFIESGGIVNFVQEDNRIRFQINADAARIVGLKISSKLLSLAIISSR